MTQTDPRAIAADHAGTTGALVTLVSGSTFCVSGRSGDIDPRAAQGLFFHDTRILSRWHVRVGPVAPQIIAATSEEPYRALFVGHIPGPDASTALLVERRRYIGDGMREDIRVRNLAEHDVDAVVSIEVAADFADLFEVKEGRVVEERAAVATTARADGDSFHISTGSGTAERAVRIHADGAVAGAAGLTLQLRVPARGETVATVLVTPVVAGREYAASFPLGESVEESQPAVRMRAWRSASARIHTADFDLRRTLTQSLQDLGSLRIFDPAHPDSIAVAAGAPWFMALFGRDSLLSSFMALPLEPSLALGTMRALARAQGVKIDPLTEEEPGRILHETRLGADFPLSRGDGSIYYGSADATPLFVMLLGELSRWGAPSGDVRALLPHADRALDWILHHGDRDGDGFVEYGRMTEHGLLNQGWKDSHDGINFADGRLAEAPIALCEVQGYVYAAYTGRAHLADAVGDADTAAVWTKRADELKAAFNERFWLPDREWFAVGLDRDKTPIDALTSNIGHCLWTGIVDPDKAAAVAAHLLSPAMFTGWGVRTLASTMGAYNPMSYHNGSVWPHDNALIAAGLMRCGFVDEAQQIAIAMLEAASAFGGRLPELFCGFDRSDFAVPLPYPTSCSPQAWASAAPIQLLRTLLRLDPDVPARRVWFSPTWPARYGPLTVDGIRIGYAAATAAIANGDATVSGLPADVRVVAAPRPFAAD